MFLSFCVLFGIIWNPLGTPTVWTGHDPASPYRQVVLLGPFCALFSPIWDQLGRSGPEAWASTVSWNMAGRSFGSLGGLSSHSGILSAVLSGAADVNSQTEA